MDEGGKKNKRFICIFYFFLFVSKCVLYLRRSARSLGLGEGQVELELGGKFLLGVQSIREVDSSNSAVGVDLDSKGFDIVGTICSSGEIGQVKLNLIPAFIQSHRHSTNEWLHSCCRLIVRSSKSSPNIFIIQNLYLESKVFFQVLNNHDQERKLDTEGLLRVGGSGNVVGGNIGSHNLQNRRLNILISDSLDVTISDLLIPNVQRLGTNREQNRQEAGLEGILEH
mmetsp:Transcript_35385/g.49358  ORF Transcript_35385/g.49358 Transcript_35385/m.49358 type:complete len:226 (-) Transcript_35385:42-719(-)